MEIVIIVVGASVLSLICLIAWRRSPSGDDVRLSVQGQREADIQNEATIREQGKGTSQF